MAQSVERILGKDEVISSILISSSILPVWWNWQTPGTQNPVYASTCGFDPRHRHHAQYNPNQILPVGDGFGLFVYFEKFEHTNFKNGIIKRPNSKPRGPRKKKQS